VQRGIVLDGVPLQQVSDFKYLGSWIIENARCEEDIGARAGMATAAFCQSRGLMGGNVRSTKIEILTVVYCQCYIADVGLGWGSGLEDKCY
jgi:hypothetical protein